jgi:hypothetical protein
MQMQLDFLVDDADTAKARMLAAGTTKFDIQPGDHFSLPFVSVLGILDSPASSDRTARLGGGAAVVRRSANRATAVPVMTASAK